MAEGDVVLENVRFFAEEEKNEAGFAEKSLAWLRSMPTPLAPLTVPMPQPKKAIPPQAWPVTHGEGAQ